MALKGTPCVMRITELDPCAPITVCDDPAAESLVCVGALAGDLSMKPTYEDDVKYESEAACDGRPALKLTETGKRLDFIEVEGGFCDLSPELESWLTGKPSYADALGNVVGIGNPGIGGSVTNARFMVEFWTQDLSCDSGDCGDGGGTLYRYRAFYLARDFRVDPQNQQPGKITPIRFMFKAYPNPVIDASNLPKWAAGSGAWPSVDFPSPLNPEVFADFTTTDVPSVATGAKCEWVKTPKPDICTIAVQPTVGAAGVNRITSIVVNGTTYGPSPYATDPAGIAAFLNAIPGLTGWVVTQAAGVMTMSGKAKCGWVTAITTTPGVRTFTSTPVTCP